MVSSRVARVSACVVFAIVLAAPAAMPLAAAISAPPDPKDIVLAPGWGPVTGLEPSFVGTLASIGSSPNGSLRVVTAFTTNIFNFSTVVSGWTNYLGTWSSLQLHNGITSHGDCHWAFTNDPDRTAAGFCFVTHDGEMHGFVTTLRYDGRRVSSPANVTGDGLVSDGQIAASPTGALMTTWVEWNGSAYNIFSNHSAPAAGWDGKMPAAEGFDYYVQPQLVAVGDDDFLLAWWSYDANGTHFWSAHYVAGEGWKSPELAPHMDGDLHHMALAGSPAYGGAVLCAALVNGTRADVVLWRWGAAGGWLAPFIAGQVNRTGLRMDPAQLALDSSGMAHVLWSEGNDSHGLRNVNYAKVSPSGVLSNEWTHEFTIAAAPGLDVSDGGNVLIWQNHRVADRPALSVARYVADSGWRPLERVDVEFSPLHQAAYASATLADSGNVTALWLNMDGNQQLPVVRIFTAGNDPPAVSLKAPLDGSVTSSPTVQVDGLTAPGVKVQVDGVDAAVAADGSFSLRVALEPGTHLIEVFAVDEWGNTGHSSVTVTFADPVPPLQAEVQAAHELTHVAQQQAGRAEARAANLSDQLNQTNAILTAQANSTGTQEARVASAQSAVGTATMLGAVGILAGIAGVATSLLRGGRGGGGGGETRMSDRPMQQAQGAEPASRGKPEPQGPSPPPSGGGGPP